MHRLIRLLATGAVVMPVVGTAQTANTPGGSASTGSALDQTQGAPARALPRRTQTATDLTNPTGTLPAKERAVGSNATLTGTPGTPAKKRRWVRTNRVSPTADAPPPAPDVAPTR